MTDYNIPAYWFRTLNAPLGVGLKVTNDKVTGLYQYRVNTPISPINCYDQWNGLVPSIGHQDTGVSPGTLDWGTELDFMSDLKIGYVGERVYVEVGSGKAEDNVLMPHDFFHFRKEFYSYPVGSGSVYGSKHSGTALRVIADRLPRMVQRDRTKPFEWTPSMGILFDNRLCKDETRKVTLAAETKAFRKAMSTTNLADVGSALVEVRELASLFTTSMAAFGPLLRVVDKELTASNIIKILNEISAAWLQVQYGLKPLFQTIVEYQKNIAKRVQRGKLDKSVVKGSVSVKDLITCTESFGDGEWVYGAENPPGSGCSNYTTEKVGGKISKVITCDGDTIHSEEFGGSPSRLMYSVNTAVDFSVKAEWLIVTDPAFVLDQFNLNPNLGHFWEATRLSFIVDWFWKVGDFLSQIEAQHFSIISGNASFEYKTTCRTSMGGSGSATHFMRTVTFDPNGNPLPIDSGRLYPDTGQLHYGLAELEKGTLVSKIDSRFGNAMALLVVLSTTLARCRTFAGTLPANSYERRRILQLLNQIG